MEKRLQNQRKRFRILSFIFSLLLIFSSFGLKGQIYSESFDALDGKGQDGTTLDTASVNNAWIIDKTGGSFSAGDWFKVVTASSRFEVLDVDGIVYWYTPVLDISTYADVAISVDLGYVTTYSGHYLTVSASLDGGQFVDIGSLTHGGGPTATISASGLIGSSLQVRIEAYTTYSSYIWYIDNVSVTGTSGYTHETLSPGTTTWTSPAGVTSVKAYAWGAGGGGGYGGATGGAGGGGGAFAMNTLSVTASTSYDCFIGTGGTGGVQSTTTNATNGNVSWLSLTGVAPTNTSEGVLAAGGTAGGNNTSSTSAGGTTAASYGTTEYAGGTSGGGGSSGGGSGAGAGGFLSTGSNGTTGYNGTGSADKTGGLSGLTPIGDGQGGTGSGSSHGTNGTLPGGGGGGANDAAGYNGGAGGDGRIILAYILPPTYYWVGGTGNWSDFANHWSTTSGGAADAPNAPTASDNVVFDANSFSAPGQTVSINADAYCKNMNWTGATNSPTLAFPNLAPSYYDLYIAGSATFITAMSFTNSNAGYIYFTSTSTGETINTNGLSIPCQLIFNGNGGEWTLQNDLTSGVINYDFQVLTGASVIANSYNLNNYGSLTVSGTGNLNLSSGTGSFANSATITGTVSISTGTLDVNGTFNATGGNITFSGAGNLNLGGATNTSLGTFTPSTGTVTYDRVGAQGVVASTYYNLVFSGAGSNTKTAAGAVNVSNNLTVDASTIYALGATTTTVTGTSDINGTISISTGTYDSNGTFDATGGNVTFTGAGFLLLGGATNTSLGTLTTSAGTVNYDRAGLQDIVEDYYYDLVISGGSTKSIVGTENYVCGSGLLTVESGSILAIGDNELKRFTAISDGTAGAHIEGTVTINNGLWTTTFGASQQLTSTGGTITCTGTGTIRHIASTTPDFGTFTAGNGIVQYNRGGDQNIASAPTYYNLLLSGSTKTLIGNTTVTNDLTTSGTLAISTYTIDVAGTSTITGTITISTGTYDANGAFDATGGAVTFSDDGFLYLGSTVTSLGTLTLSYGADATTGCTVVYDAAGAQDVAAVDYYNLIIDGSGTKTLSAGTIDIGGSNGEGVLTVDAGCIFAIGDNTITHTSLHDLTTTYNSSIVGTVTLNNGTWTPTYGQYGQLVTSGSITVTGTGAIYLKGGGGHTLGTFTEGSGTVSYSRNGSMTVVSDTYNHLIIDGTSGTKTLGGAIDVNGDLTLTNNGGGLLDVSGSNYAINLAGTWTNNGTFTQQSGTVTLDGGSDQAISGSSSTTFYNLTNSNTATTVTLNQGITVTNTLAMSGTANIDMNANNIDLSSAGTITGETNGDRIYDTAGTTDVSGVITTTRVLNAPSSENVGGMGAVITSAANLGSTTIKRGHIQQTGNANTSILRYYSITPTTNTGLNATLEFNYFESELNGQSANEADFVLFRSTDGGTNWTNKSGVANAAGNNVTLSAIDAFSLWTTSSESVSPLPITLLSFNAIPLEDMIELKWVTASEKNSHLFEIEKSINGIDFNVITTTKAAGESIELLNYTEYDRSPTQGLSYYRLKQIDNDGKYNYSNIVSVVYGSKSKVKLIPNPSNGLIATLMLKDLNYNNENDATLEVYSSTGELVYSKVVKMTNISFTISPEKRFAPGYYTVKLAQENRIIANEKMIVQW